MNRILYISLLLLMCASAGAQVRIISATDIMQRVTASPDTTFILNFWATWCVPCMKEMPAFNKAHKRFQDKPIRVLMVNVERPAALENKVIPTVKQRPILAEVVMLEDKDPNIYIDLFGADWQGTIPCTIIFKALPKPLLVLEKPLNFKSIRRAIGDLTN